VNVPFQAKLREALLSYNEAAVLLRVSKRTLMRWIDAGRLPVVILSQRTRRIRPADLREFIHQTARPDQL
jgi:excisionase family DNA binding protein